MSAPKTNIERQKRRHKPVLIGFAVVAVFAGLIFLFNMWSAVDDNGPIDALVEDDTPVVDSDPGE